MDTVICSAVCRLPNPPLQRPGASVASLPLAPAAEHRYVGRRSVAYLRYGPDSDWYVFWYSDKAEADEEERTGRRLPKADTRLAIWHADHRAGGPIFTYSEVRLMLDANDFSRIPGFEPPYLAVLRSALADFVREVDDEFRA
jgi:hypothetical protein